MKYCAFQTGWSNTCKWKQHHINPINYLIDLVQIPLLLTSWGCALWEQHYFLDWYTPYELKHSKMTWLITSQGVLSFLSQQIMILTRNPVAHIFTGLTSFLKLRSEKSRVTRVRKSRVRKSRVTKWRHPFELTLKYFPPVGAVGDSVKPPKGTIFPAKFCDWYYLIYLYTKDNHIEAENKQTNAYRRTPRLE